MLDPWLSEQLGYPVYNSTTPPDSDERSLTWTKVPVQDVALLDTLTGLGFRVIEVSGRFESEGATPNATGLYVQFSRTEHHEPLLNIAEACFDHSRFHQDSLTRPAANQIKREWLSNCLNGTRGLGVLVACGSKSPTGFLAVRADDGDARVVDLLGVTPVFYRRGIGRGLLTSFQKLNPGRTLIAGTSLANTAAVSLYQSCGFKLHSASYVLHLHRGVQ